MSSWVTVSGNQSNVFRRSASSPWLSGTAAPANNGTPQPAASGARIASDSISAAGDVSLATPDGALISDTDAAGDLVAITLAPTDRTRPPSVMAMGGSIISVIGPHLGLAPITGPQLGQMWITGALIGQTMLDDSTLQPFSDLTLGEQTPSDEVSVVVAVSYPGNGVLTNLGGGTYDANTGVYSFTGSLSDADAALEGLVFTPSAHQVLAGETVTSTFSIGLNDATTAQGAGGQAASGGFRASDDSTTVTTTATALPNGSKMEFDGFVTLDPRPADDVLFRNVASGQVLDWSMSGGTVSSGVLLGVATPDWQIVSTGNFYGVTTFNGGDSTLTGVNADDILFENQDTGLILDWQIANGTFVAGHPLGVAAPGWEVLGTGDFHGNGADDILFENTQSGLVLEWEMQNGSVVAGHALGVANFDWKFVGVGTFHSAGMEDILFQNVNSGEVLDWQISNGVVIGNQMLGTVSPGWTAIGTANWTSVPVVDGQPDSYAVQADADIVFQDNDAQALALWTIRNGTVAATASTLAGPLGGQSVLPSGESVIGIGDYGGTNPSDPYDPAWPSILLQQAGSGQVTMLNNPFELGSFPVPSVATVGVVTPDWRLA